MTSQSALGSGDCLNESTDESAAYGRCRPLTHTTLRHTGAQVVSLSYMCIELSKWGAWRHWLWYIVGGECRLHLGYICVVCGVGGIAEPSLLLACRRIAGWCCFIAVLDGSTSCRQHGQVRDRFSHARRQCASNACPHVSSLQQAEIQSASCR